MKILVSKDTGTVHLAIVDKDDNFIRNGNFASGDITKHYPFTTGSDDMMAISWMDGDDVKLATIPSNLNF